jgi:transcriptional regulator with XRE-family HTH domain
MQNVKDDILLMRLGQKIKTLRKERKLTQGDLGFAINNHGEQIGRIERGELNVSICTLNKICQGLQVSFIELFEGI